MQIKKRLVIVGAALTGLSEAIPHCVQALDDGLDLPNTVDLTARLSSLRKLLAGTEELGKDLLRPQFGPTKLLLGTMHAAALGVVQQTRWALEALERDHPKIAQRYKRKVPETRMTFRAM